MQNAKDTFYMAIRERVAALNPARTIVVRGQIRPGVVVEENELVSSQMPVDAFVLRWAGMKLDPQEPMALAAMRCEIVYATDGSSGGSGMDRGRLLQAMDAELAAALLPRCAVKMNYAVTPAAAMATQVFWGDVTFGAAKAVGERLERTAEVTVFAYQEAGER